MRCDAMRCDGDVLEGMRCDVMHGVRGAVHVHAHAHVQARVRGERGSGKTQWREHGA